MSHAEKEELVEIVTKYEHILKNKGTDRRSSRAKRDCWNDSIANDFNGMRNIHQFSRTGQQLKLIFHKMKDSIKKDLVKDREGLKYRYGAVPYKRLVDPNNPLLKLMQRIKREDSPTDHNRADYFENVTRKT